MKKIPRLILIFSLVSSSICFGQPLYKTMMDDNTYNFYEVVEAAEAYFKEHPKGKGSGWKPYQRWKELNEYKYYPDGDRQQVDPYFVEKAYADFLTQYTTKSFYTGGWRDLGPYSVDSITGHYSAGMGRVEHFYVNPSNDQQLYLGSRSGGFWRSLDGGQSWENTTDFLVAAGVDAIGVSPTNPDSVLINVKNSRNGTTHGVYRSVDGGATWNVTNFNPGTLGWGGLGSNEKIYKIVYHPTIPNLIFVGTSRGLYRSTDNLSTWTQLLANADIVDIDFHSTNDSILYVYDNYYWGQNPDAVLASNDIGLSFTPSNILTGNNNARLYISTSDDCPSCVYAASSNGIWKSVNEGASFIQIANNLNESCRGFAVNDQDTSKMIYGYLDIEGSSDGGQTFSQLTFWSQGSANNFNNGVYVHADLRDAQCINGVYYVATDGYLSKSSNNGTTWDILSQGTGIRENYSLGVSQSNHYRSIVGSQDNGTSIKHETTWLEFYGADGMEGIIHPLNDDWMIGSLQYGGRRRTKDGGITQGGATPPGQSGGWVAPLMYDPNDHMTVYSLGKNINKSLNFGNSWDSIGTPSFSNTISEAVIAQNNSSVLVVSRGSSIEKSIDGGATFTDISNNLPNFTVTDIAFDPRNDSTIIVTFARYQNDNQKVFISTDQGTSWTNITHNLSNMPIRKVVIDHLPTPNIYLGGEIGVYTMPLNGNNWVLYDPDLPKMAIEDMEVMWGTNTIRAATWGRGLWEYSLVGRSDYPAIIKTSITQTPDENQPVENAAQFVTSVFSYDHTITSAYVKYSINDLSFSNTLPMTNTVDSTWVTSSPIPGQAVNTKVYFKVFAVGANNDTTETYKFMYTIKPACVSYGNMSYGTAVTNVMLNTISNQTGKTQPYTDYSATHSTGLILGNNYDLTLHLNTDGNYTIHSRAWIDWNQNGVFTDPGEEYNLGTAQNVVNGITSNSPLNIQVPSDAVLGSTKMRVSAKYNSPAQPCETGFDGEVEDYEILILEPELDYTVTHQATCINDLVLFEYTGSHLDSIHWNFSNGSTTYAYDNYSQYVVFSDTGTYTLSISGYLNNQVYTTDSVGIVVIYPTDSVSISETICKGESYTLGTQVLSSAGTYFETFSTATCDSVVTVNLSVTEINTSVNQQGFTLEASNANASSYQWINCETNTIIPGETNQSFSPDNNGSYAVIINDLNCQDTSDCYTVSGLFINDSEGNLMISTFPNPVSNSLIIDLNSTYKSVSLKIFNEAGQLILDNSYDQQQIITVDMEKEAQGIYFIHLKVNDREKTIEIVKI